MLAEKQGRNKEGAGHKGTACMHSGAVGRATLILVIPASPHSRHSGRRDFLENLAVAGICGVFGNFKIKRSVQNGY